MKEREKERERDRELERESALAHMERMGATMSREAMRMPSSAMTPVKSRAQVGSPLALPCPNTWHGTGGGLV